MTPEWEEAHNTIRSPPVLSKAAVVWDVTNEGSSRLWTATTVGPGPPSTAVTLAGAVGVRILVVAVLEYPLRLPAASVARTR